MLRAVASKASVPRAITAASAVGPICAYMAGTRFLNSSPARLSSRDAPESEAVPPAPTELFKNWNAVNDRKCPASFTVARKEGQESLSRRFDDHLNPDKSMGIDHPFVFAAVGAMFGLQLAAHMKGMGGKKKPLVAEEHDAASFSDSSHERRYEEWSA
eukprot:TRINITY_DN6878_c0_g1_i1.p1 TRINITY_DN6878_c0_g1~~TRINITY_DN6878_c0_g1_i1.p1  ORF type:complete len:158 (-),score=29.57 TRINITY_DN6878_c0_g1_i1:425-898(-)